MTVRNSAYLGLFWLALICAQGCDTRIASNESSRAAANPAASPPAEPAASPPVELAARPPVPANADQDAGYGRDIERVCFAESLSGALERPDAERMYTVADWLGRNIETERGRLFLAEFARVAPPDKPAFLERAARAVGLARCPLAETWSRASASNP